MNTELSNGPAEAGREQRQKPQRLDQASIREWLTTEVVVALPRWGLVSAGILIVGLLLIALD
jgi:hypothetical protein